MKQQYPNQRLINLFLKICKQLFLYSNMEKTIIQETGLIIKNPIKIKGRNHQEIKLDPNRMDHSKVKIHQIRN